MSFILFGDLTTVDWAQLAVVFARAPLGHREPERLRQTFQNSGVRCFVWYDHLLVVQDVPSATG